MRDLVYPDPGQWIGALEAGQNAGMTRRRDQATMRAGSLMTGGDYKGAAAEAFGAGDLKTGLAIRDLGAQEAATTRHAGYGAKVAAGKGDEAAKEAAALGDFKVAEEITKALETADERQLSVAKRHAETIAGIVAPLGDMADLNQRKAFIQAHTPDLVGAGYTAEQVAGFDPTDANLAVIYTHAVGVQKAAEMEEQKRHNLSMEGKPQYMAVPVGGTLERVDGGRGGGAPTVTTVPGASGQAHTGQSVADVISPLIEVGATMTSGVRSPAHNAEVGGVPGSHHITGEAADLVPPHGMTLAELGQHARERIPGARVIVENDHVHVQWGGGHPAAPGGGGVPDTIHGPPAAPKERARPATPEEKAAYGVAADVPAQIDAQGDFHVITGTGAANKRVPATVQSGYVDNRKSITQIDAAIAAIKANPGHLGLRSKLGDAINQRLDAGGVPVRASVANIGSLLIHDRSGAAVTAAEQPRLLPFIPAVSDTDEAAIKKLMLLKEQYVANNTEIETVFGEDAGYSPMGGAGGGGRSGPAASPSPRAAPAAPKPAAPKPPHQMTDAEIKAQLGLP